MNARNILRLGVITTSLLGALACSGGGSSTEPEAVQGGADGDETQDALVVAVISDLGNLNPVVFETASDNHVISNIMMPTIDPSFDCTIKKAPGLATEWSWDETGTRLSMTLRDDIQWSDGKPVTAQDIAFTYELVADPMVASPRIGHVAKLDPAAAPKVIDDHHIEWHFTTAFDRDTQVAHVNLNVVPKHIFQDADRGTLRGHPNSLNPLSSGPWRLAKHEANQRFVLEPNPAFTGPEEYKPHLKRVIFRVLPEYTTRLNELKNGAVDMMDSLNIEDADALKKTNPEIRIVRRGWRSSDYVAWNLDNPLFSDKRVRHALAKAVDIDDMIGKLLTGEDGEVYARRSVGTLTPELCNVHNDDIVPIGFDASEAKSLFAEAGWTDSDGDGWLDKDGKKFEFTLTTNAGNKRRADSSIFLQAFYKEVGVKVVLEQIESNTFFKNLRKREFQAALAGWEAALFVDPTPMWKSDASGDKQEFNFTNYHNNKVDELIAKGLSEADPSEANPMWKELQAIVYEDQPYLFLWWRDELIGVHERFENTSINVLSRLDNLHKWSVPDDKVKYKR
jgi:peptide/nickel transport system substrate-binding protein